MRAVAGGRGSLLLLLGLGALWGTAFMFISLGLPYFPPLLFAALRFDLAGLVLLAVAALRGTPLRPADRAQWGALGVAAVLNVGAYHAFLFWGQQFTTAAVAAVLVGLNPLLTTAASRALLADERVGLGGLAGLGLGFGGVVILATLKPGSLLDARGLGELAVVAAVASWALGSTLVRRSRHGMDVFAFTTWQMLAGAALLHVASLALEGVGGAEWNAASVASLLYLALVSSALGFVVYFTLLDRLGPIRANLVSYVAPVFAALAGFLALGEPFEVRAVLAFLLIATGFGLVARPKPLRAGTGAEAAKGP